MADDFSEMQKAWIHSELNGLSIQVSALRQHVDDVFEAQSDAVKAAKASADLASTHAETLAKHNQEQNNHVREQLREQALTFAPLTEVKRHDVEIVGLQKWQASHVCGDDRGKDDRTVSKERLGLFIALAGLLIALAVYLRPEPQQQTPSPPNVVQIGKP
jgi:hypothetical protein